MHLTEYGNKYKLFKKDLINSSNILITLRKSTWYEAKISLDNSD